MKTGFIPMFEVEGLDQGGLYEKVIAGSVRLGSMVTV